MTTSLRGVARLLLVGVLGLSLGLTLTACGPDYADLPLPGKNVSGDTYRLTAVFDEALNLAQGAPVKVNGVPVGRVQEVTAHDFKAVVVMDVKVGTELRVGSSARLRYDTPLGELFIQITPALSGRTLSDGDRLRDQDTTTAPTVEDTLASASLLVNGGGLAQLQTITSELNTALGGREPVVRRALAKTNRFLRLANDSTGDIDRALRALATTARVLRSREDTIDRALDEVVPISRVLRENTDDLVRMLVALDRLSVTAQRVVGATRSNLLRILREVGPLMDEVIKLEPRLVPGLTSLVAAAEFLDVTVEGDWLPLEAKIDMDETQLVLPGDSATVPPEGGPGLPDLPLPDPEGGLGLSGLLGGGRR